MCVKYFFKSRGHATAATLGGSVENYLRLMRMEDLSEITYMDAAGILNFIESCSPVNSGVCSHGTFLDALEAAHKVATELWQPDTQLWREEIAEEKVKLKEFVQAEIAKVNASIKGKAKPKRDGKVVSMNQN